MTSAVKLTPAQAALLKTIRSSHLGVCLNCSHAATVNGLMRRGLVTVWQGRVVAVQQQAAS